MDRNSERLKRQLLEMTRRKIMSWPIASMSESEREELRVLLKEAFKNLLDEVVEMNRKP